MQLSAPQSNHKDRQCTRLSAFERGLNRVLHLLTQRSGKADLIHMEPAGFGC
jgi:hypothetical protein